MTSPFMILKKNNVCNSLFLKSSILMDVFCSDEDLSLDKRSVCAAFLEKDYCLSCVQQPSVKYGLLVNWAPLTSSEQKNVVIMFVNHLTARTFEQMPNSKQLHLPFLVRQKCTNFSPRTTEHFIARMCWYQQRDFLSTCKNSYLMIKIRIALTYSSCTTCDQLRPTPRVCSRSGLETECLLCSNEII